MIERGEESNPVLFLSFSFYPSISLSFSFSRCLILSTPQLRVRASIYLPTYTMFRPCTTFSSLGDRSFFSLRANYLRPRRCPRHHVDRPLFLPINKHRQRITDAQVNRYRPPRHPVTLCLSFSFSLSFFLFLSSSLSLSFSAHLLVFVVKHLSNFGNRRKLVAYIDSNGRIF